MRSDRDALFAAICANPEEDTPRLMFADWLEENDGEKYAEFIRLQCELAQLTDDASDSQALYEFLVERDYVTRPSADWTQIDYGIHRRIALTMRADDLLRQYGVSWTPKLPKSYGVKWSEFHRGFPHCVTLGSQRKLQESVRRLRRTVPAVTLKAEQFTSRFVEQLADVGPLNWISGLILENESTTGLDELGHHPDAACVRTIHLLYGIQDKCVSVLAAAPSLIGVRSLDLTKCAIGPEAAQLLFESKNLRTLRRLHVHGMSNWTVDTIRAFVAGGFTELISLRFSHCDLNDDAVELLANCPHLSKLRTLDLAFNNITGRGVTALLTSPYLANVAFLGLEHNPGNGLDANRLADATPGSLRMFHGHSCHFRTGDVRVLTRCPRLRTLWYLDLDDNDLSTAALRELTRGFKDWCPPILWLTHNNRIDDRGAELLAKWKAAAALRVLHLKYTAITEAGARKLLDSPHLAGLEGLGVPRVDEEMESQMEARFRNRNVRY